MSIVGGYWRYTFSKIEIIISDILDYEVVKIYFTDGKLAEEYRTKSGQGIKSVYNHVLKQYVAMEDRKLPKVILIDIKVKIITHVLEV